MNDLIKQLREYIWLIIAAASGFGLLFLGERSPWAYVVAQNIFMIILIFLARRIVSNDPSKANLAWGVTGALMLAFAVGASVLMKQFDGQADVNFYLQTMALIWAPIGSGLIVGPIMATKRQN